MKGKKMAEKERFEILLEEIRGDVKLVLEGHGVLDRKIDSVKQDLGEKMESIKYEILTSVDRKIEKAEKSLKQEINQVYTFLSHDVKEVGDKLDTHVQLPAHA
jgi:hypothetical protein